MPLKPKKYHLRALYFPLYLKSQNREVICDKLHLSNIHTTTPTISYLHTTATAIGVFDAPAAAIVGPGWGWEWC